MFVTCSTSLHFLPKGMSANSKVIFLFQVSDNLLANYLEEYEEVPWDALRYLFAIINYGGHITDDWDKRVLIAYISQFFCEEAHDTPFYR